MQAPTQNPISQKQHGIYKAVDYSARTRWLRRWRKTIYAPSDGKITSYGKSGDCGNRLELTTTTRRHGFCHLEKPLVKVGQTVKRGQAIGVMGYTGLTIPKGEPGTHLHWVIRMIKSGAYVYPPSLINEKFRIYTPSTAQ
jgi:murein DD-endopeptidase MepM/ murein hydrolase activator NlpD